MQISEINKSQIKKICKFSNYYFDYLYVADSLGSLKKVQLKKLLSFLKNIGLKK